MKPVSISEIEKKVDSIYHLRDVDFISNSLSSFGFTSKSDLTRSFHEIVSAYRGNPNCQSLGEIFTESQMAIFTTFEDELRDLLGIPERRTATTTSYGFDI